MDLSNKEWFILVLGLILSIFVGVLVNKYTGREQKKELKSLSEELYSLREENKKINFIESLDEFASNVLSNAAKAKCVVLFCIPSPLLFSFQDAEFGSTDAESSKWWGRFAEPLIKNLSRESSSKLSVKLAILNDESLRKYAKDLFGDSTKAETHLQVVNLFLNKLNSCCDLVVERTFNIPSWMFITDFHLENNATATVGFTDPEKIRQEKLTKHLPNTSLASMITGIYTPDKNAVEFFRHSFDDLVTRHYFCEVVEEIKSQLRRNDIDIAYIHKLEKGLLNPKTWKPTEVIVREKR